MYLSLIEIWSVAMKLSGPRAFRPVVTVVTVVIAPFFVAIIIATWSGGRGGRSSTEPLGTWSTWSVVDVVGARSVQWSEGMYLVPSHGEAKSLGHVQPRSAYSKNPRMVVGFNW